MNQTYFAIALAGTIGAGLIAGAFFAFSTFVMGALARRPAPEAVAAMQSINVVVINPLFLTPFVGTALLGVASVVIAVLQWSRPASGWLLAGGLLYALGTFGVTVACNVPMNDALAKLSPETDEAAAYWQTYLRRWTTWNHVRTLAAVGATASFAMALCAS